MSVIIDIILQDIIDIAGQYSTHRGQEYSFPCPLCRRIGQDKTGDNLGWNASKKLLTCWADLTHSRQILREIANRKNIKKMYPKTTIKKYDINQDLYLQYALECNDYLLDSKIALDYLLEKRGITEKGVELGFIGFDKEDKKWVFPVYAHGGLGNPHKYFGFEYRSWNFKKLWKEKDTPSMMAHIYGDPFTPKNHLYICEGFLDSYIMTQWLFELNLHEKSCVYTPSCGVQSLANLLTQIPLGNFKNRYLCLDNDVAGQRTLNVVQNKFPEIFIDKTPKPLTGKDITDLYKERKQKND